MVSFRICCVSNVVVLYPPNACVGIDWMIASRVIHLSYIYLLLQHGQLSDLVCEGVALPLGHLCDTLRRVAGLGGVHYGRLAFIIIIIIIIIGECIYNY